MEKKSNDNGRNLIAKRHKILEAAMGVFSEAGYERAHIRDIARKARVSEGTIYEAFRDKEDLLHGIPEVVMPRAIEDLALHMNGIVGAVNKLRKFTWFYLHFFEAHPAWSKVVLLQIKPNSRFLHTQAYQLIRDFTRVLVHILQEGQKEGFIRSDLDLNLARQIFVGGVEHITERWLLLGKPERITPYAEELFRIFLRAFGTKRALRIANSQDRRAGTPEGGA
jgi:TetR/AcrR family fatty acid metabolism transcriptional regulator